MIFLPYISHVHKELLFEIWFTSVDSRGFSYLNYFFFKRAKIKNMASLRDLISTKIDSALFVSI